MSQHEFILRPCPGCNATHGTSEFASAPAAEMLSFAKLQSSWAGLHRDKSFFTYRRCGSCGLLYCPTYFAPEALAALYADLAPNMDMVPPDMIADTQRGYFERAADAGLTPGDYLEIGPDIGYMAQLAANRGTFDRFWLFEPNRAVHPNLREAAGKHPVTISAEMHDLSPVPDGSVGLAVMVHVLDHLIDPRAMLQDIVQKLRPGGMIAIVTHNEGSLLRRVIGNRWPPFCLQHPQLFNPQTMRRMLAEAGFDSVDVQGSSNLFPSDFLVRQAAQAAGMAMDRVALPSLPVRLRLGNILTLARRPLQAASETRSDMMESA